MKKKADVNWVLISMVIAVIVLAITVYLFWKYSTQSANQAQGIAGCKARGGSCMPACGEGTISIGKFNCKQETQSDTDVCCILVISSGGAASPT